RVREGTGSGGRTAPWPSPRPRGRTGSEPAEATSQLANRARPSSECFQSTRSTSRFRFRTRPATSRFLNSPWRRCSPSAPRFFTTIRSFRFAGCVRWVGGEQGQPRVIPPALEPLQLATTDHGSPPLRTGTFLDGAGTGRGAEARG